MVWIKLKAGFAYNPTFVILVTVEVEEKSLTILLHVQDQILGKCRVLYEQSSFKLFILFFFFFNGFFKMELILQKQNKTKQKKKKTAI